MSDQEKNTISDDLGRHADERLLHALLLHTYDDQAKEHREDRVQRAIQVISSASQADGTALNAPASTRRRDKRISQWVQKFAAIAALVFMAVAVWSLTNSPSTAVAAINRMITALSGPGDRTYHIQMEDLPERNRHRPKDEPGSLPKPGLDDATLHLRDGQQYVLVRHDPQGGLIYDGYDGRQSWRVRNGRVAETRQGLGAGGIPMPPIMANIPFTDLQSTLQAIQGNYTLEKQDNAGLPDSNTKLLHVLVRRNSRWVKGPETIEIWADQESALPQRIVFDDAKVQGNETPCRISLDLTSQTKLPGNWFSAESHATAEIRK